MEHWMLERLPSDFVRYVYEGCNELGQLLTEDRAIEQQIEAVIQEQMVRTSIEALDIEHSLSILVGEKVAKSVVSCLRFLEAHEEFADLRQAGIGEPALGFLKYLVARYGPVLKAVRRRTNHPLGWHKFGHAVTKMENGDTHLHIKLLRNDDQMLVFEDDTESMLRLINLMLSALEQVDDYQSLEKSTVDELTERYDRLMERATERGVLGPNDGQQQH